MIDIHAIRAANPLPSIAAATVKLQRAGNEWKGCCPFHADRSPSFTIYSGGERFQCFGCGAQGDVLDYVARLYGLDMIGAARVLCAGDLTKVAIPMLPAPERAVGQNDARARAIWQESKPILGTIAERYLLARWSQADLPVPANDPGVPAHTGERGVRDDG